MTDKKVQCFRTKGNNNQMIGIIAVTDLNGGVGFVAKTLERPDKNNQSNISCILEGKYICKYTQSHSLKDKDGKPLKCYEITNVPNRAGVRIHSFNYFFQGRGCISMGDSHKDINGDGEVDNTHSGNTVAAFEKYMNYEDFELEIIKAY